MGGLPGSGLHGTRPRILSVFKLPAKTWGQGAGDSHGSTCREPSPVLVPAGTVKLDGSSLARTHTRTYSDTHTHTLTRDIHTRTNTNTHTRMHVLGAFESLFLQGFDSVRWVGRLVRRQRPQHPSAAGAEIKVIDQRLSSGATCRLAKQKQRPGKRGISCRHAR